ncbi:hypothetical protein ADK76_16730 [Streptomyces griseoflavus]|nr:hypothetical protein ADK76_16730 [Streptomyces griseoflavus]
MVEWTNPRYAELVRAYRAAQEDEGRDDAPVAKIERAGNARREGVAVEGCSRLLRGGDLAVTPYSGLQR